MKTLLIGVASSGKTEEVLLLLAEHACSKWRTDEPWRSIRWEISGNWWITKVVAEVLLKESNYILKGRVRRTLEDQAILYITKKSQESRS